jgi:glycolate oxidase iron-sulfur subunit
MQHSIPVEKMFTSLGPQIAGMARAIESCIHCGFCLPTCPTYQVLGEEMDSPRGRITLMKAVLEGDLDPQGSKPFIDRCLGCLACVTACPSGVQYEELLMPFRAYLQREVKVPIRGRMHRKLIEGTLPYPSRFRLVASAGQLAKPIQGALPREIASMLSLLPDHLPETKPVSERYPAEGEVRARVAFLTGCVQQVLAPELNWATIRVLVKNGVEVLIPRKQVCCGALQMHIGDDHEARKLARNNLNVFPRDVDAIITNAAGCGSGMRAYEMLFAGLPEYIVAREFSGKVKDVSLFLAELGLIPPPPLEKPLTVVYHDACHLAHAQGVREAPRQLLQAVPNLSLREIPESDMCCGSAGTYNLDQPEIADALGRRKVGNILNTDGEAVVMGNIGCMVQIRTHLREVGKSLPVYHLLEVLDLAYRNQVIDALP